MSGFFGNTFTRIAFKEHRCEWCGGPIPKGERHAHYSGTWDSEWQNWRMHDECYAECPAETHYDGFMPYEGEMPKRVKKLVAERKGECQ